MSPSSRVIALIVLIAFVSGCTSYRPAALPRSGAEPGGNGETAVLAPDDQVKVTLTDGGTLSGVVVSATADELVLKGDGNFGYPEHRIPAGEIARVEVEYISDQDKSRNTGILILSVVALATALVVGFTNAMSHMN